MKKWVKVLIIGIVLMIIGFSIPINIGVGFAGWYLAFFGIALIVLSIIAAITRLFGSMLSD